MCVAFTVADFRDLIDLLAQHPEWRAELRRHVLSDDLLELPALVRQLVEAQARAEARLEGVEGRLDRLEATVQQLAEAQARTEARVTDLAEAQARAEARLEGVEGRLERVEARLEGVEARLERVEARLEKVEGRLDRIDDRLGRRDGMDYERDFARLGLSYLYPLARRLRHVEPGRLADVLDDAIDAGLLTTADRQAIMLADVVFSGRRQSDDQQVYLVVEASLGIGPHDVERAVERATLLEKVGRPVLAVVAGDRITQKATSMAREHGVWSVVSGRIVAPRDA